MKMIYFALAIIAFMSCAHDTYHNVTPAVTCDTTNVSYVKDIQPILNSNCYSCHSTKVIDSTNEGGFDVQQFSSLKLYLQLGFRGDGIYGSMFIHDIEHTHFAKAMPPDYSMDSCSVSKIRSWIKEGAPNN